MASTKVPWSRITAEFIAILAGVTLALLSDDWREYRGDREDERLALQEITSDLETDSVQLADLQEGMQRTEQAVLWMLRNLSAPLLEDSVIRGVSPAWSDLEYEQVRSGYGALMNSGKLSIIRDPQIRRGMVEYYEGTQPYMRQRYEAYMTVLDEVYDAWGAHIGAVPDSTGDVFREAVNTTLLHSWEEISRDNRLVFKMTQIGSWASGFALRVPPVLKANSDLRALIKEKLDT
jgi:hypothetical protein